MNDIGYSKKQPDPNPCAKIYFQHFSDEEIDRFNQMIREYSPEWDGKESGHE